MWMAMRTPQCPSPQTRLVYYKVGGNSSVCRACVSGHCGEGGGDSTHLVRLGARTYGQPSPDSLSPCPFSSGEGWLIHAVSRRAAQFPPSAPLLWLTIFVCACPPTHRAQGIRSLARAGGAPQ